MSSQSYIWKRKSNSASKNYLHTHCRASQSSCCRPWHPLQQEPVVHLLTTVRDRKLLDKSRLKLFTLQPSSSLVPAGSGSVLPTPLVEWRPGSSFSTYSAYPHWNKRLPIGVENSCKVPTLFLSYMLPRATSQRRSRPVLFLLLVAQ